MMVEAAQNVITGMTSHSDGGGAVLGPNRHQKLGLRVSRMLSCVKAITARNRQATTWRQGEINNVHLGLGLYILFKINLRCFQALIMTYEAHTDTLSACHSIIIQTFQHLGKRCRELSCINQDTLSRS